MTTPLMKHLFYVSFILIILFLASQSFQCSSAHELDNSPGSAVLNDKWDNTVSGNSDLKDIDVVSKETNEEKEKEKKKEEKEKKKKKEKEEKKKEKEEKKKKKKKHHKTKGEKNAAHGLMQKQVSPFQVFAYVGYFVFFGFLLF